MTVGQRDKNTRGKKELKHQKEANKNASLPKQAFTQLLSDGSTIKNADYNELRSSNLSGYAAKYLRKFFEHIFTR